MYILLEQAQPFLRNLVKRLPVLQRNDLELTRKFSKRRPVRYDAIAGLEIEGEDPHQIDNLMPDIGVPCRDVHFLFDVREEPVRPDYLGVNVGL